MPDEWAFREGDIIQQSHEPHAAGGVPLGKSEYRIKRRLREVQDGDRFYHVEKEEGGTHLYSAGAIEHGYTVVSEAEARVDWGEFDA